MVYLTLYCDDPALGWVLNLEKKLFLKIVISIILNLFRVIFSCPSTVGESRVSGVLLASLSRGRHDTARPSQTTRHKSTISPKYTKRKPKTHAEISEAKSNICRCVSWTILSEFRCVSHLLTSAWFNSELKLRLKMMMMISLLKCQNCNSGV